MITDTKAREESYQEIRRKSNELADYVCAKINGIKYSEKTQSEIKYTKQATLEELITILKNRV